MAIPDLPVLIERIAAELVTQRRIPRATYRLQFNKTFTFKDAEALVPYLDALGISDVYASPILKAVPGSMHGYDICDPRQLNPELGTPEDFQRLSNALKARSMGLMMDIVPNHMGIADNCNEWWFDVLENGPSSPYAHYFDIDWKPVKRELENKVLLPVLEDQYGAVLESGKLKLVNEEGAFYLVYGERRLPIAPGTYELILDFPLKYLVTALGEADERVQELQSILTAINYLPSRTESDSAKLAERQREKEIIKRRLAALHSASDEVRAAFDEVLTIYNGIPGDPRSFDLLDALINAQVYRFAYWRVAAEEINYRRFFDINSMVAIRTEQSDVFEATHELIFRLLTAGQVMALRIDHPDGLWNPAAYFRKLQEEYVKCAVIAEIDEELSPNVVAELEQTITTWFDDQYHREGRFSWALYVVVEKILSETEPLPLNWAVDGTTGYSFMSLVNSLFVDNTYEAELSAIFSKFTGRSVTYNQLEYNSKKMIMQDTLAGEINSLAYRLERLSEKNRYTRDFTLNGLLSALREVIACLPIYRTYITGIDNVSARDRQFIEEAVREAKRRSPRTAEAVFDYVRDTLLLRKLDQYSEEAQQELIDFVMRFQQITGPVMAKSVEDTLFYVYNRLVSVNEVGGNPAAFGISAEQFADENQRRCRLWPRAMLATSTHDTKRSEDVRARLNVLSEIPQEWSEALQAWSHINSEHKVMLDTGLAPSANDEYLLYQTLLGTYPFQMDDPDTYTQRIVQYMAKATKEAKVFTSWTNINAAYDQAVEQFVRAVLQSEVFLRAFLPLQRRIACFGQFNSLGQTLLKLTCPGVPDTYRGTEVWDFSLVDPDNRRPVNYEHLHTLLAEVSAHPGNRQEFSEGLLAHSEDGRIKLYVIKTALDFRRDHPQVSLEAPYQPLDAQGGKREHVCAFTRVYEGEGVLVIVPRLVVGITEGREKPPIGDIWADTNLIIPGEYAGKNLRNLFTGETIEIEAYIPLATLLRHFPVGLFAFDTKALSS